MGRGSIEVNVYRVVPLLPVEPTKTTKYDWSMEQAGIPEKAKKALLTHSVMYASYC